MIRDRIVYGRNSFKVREKLITKGVKPTLDKAVDKARSHAQLTAIATETVAENQTTLHASVNPRPADKGFAP